VWVDLAYTGTPNEVWTRDTTNLNSGTWREIADVAGIENLVGTVHSDLLRGDGNNNILIYTGGLDQLDGRGGVDTADFSRFGSAVWVDLAYAGREAWTRNGSTVTSGTWREIADLANIENLVGTQHSDLLWGNNGVNRIEGGAGNDTLTGRAGNDTFFFRDGFGQDTVADFTGTRAAAGDVIELSLGAAFDTFAEVQAVGTQLGANTVFSFGGGNTLTLSNTILANLHQNDFLFS
jgi:Ca2+-binding RTX toxin-like protein